MFIAPLTEDLPKLREERHVEARQDTPPLTELGLRLSGFYKHVAPLALCLARSRDQVRTYWVGVLKAAPRRQL